MDKADLRRERRRIQNRESQRRFSMYTTTPASGLPRSVEVNHSIGERHRLRQTQVGAHTENLRTRTRRVATSSDETNKLITPQDFSEDSQSFQSTKTAMRSYDVAAGVWNQRRASQRAIYPPSTTGHVLNTIEPLENTFHSPMVDPSHPIVHTRLPSNESNVERGLEVDPRVWSSFSEAAYRNRDNDVARERPYTFVSPASQAYSASSNGPGAGLIFTQQNPTSFAPWTSLPVSFAADVNSKYTTSLFVNR